MYNFLSIFSSFSFCVTLCHCLAAMSARLAYNGEAAWRRRGEHYRLLEPQTVNFPRKVIRSYTPACAKPLVTCWHFFLSINCLLNILRSFSLSNPRLICKFFYQCFSISSSSKRRIFVPFIIFM